MNIYKNTVATLSGTELIEIDAKQHEVKYGDVFFTTSSETPEEVAMSSIWLGNQEHTYLNSFCFGFRPEVDIDPFFLAYTLRAPTFRSDAIFLAQGISRYNISKNRLMEVRIGIPSSKEQKKIGELFRSLDQTITLHQRAPNDAQSRLPIQTGGAIFTKQGYCLLSSGFNSLRISSLNSLLI